MRHRKKVKKLGKTASHRKAMLRNLLTSLFEHNRITTTEHKAKFARPFADKYITKAIKGDLANKRRIISFLMKREVAHDLINEIAYRYKDQPTGGYTRVIKLGMRQGDGAKMAILELVDPESRKKSKRKFSKHTTHKAEDFDQETKSKSKKDPKQKNKSELKSEVDPIEANVVSPITESIAPHGEKVIEEGDIQESEAVAEPETEQQPEELSKKEDGI